MILKASKSKMKVLVAEYSPYDLPKLNEVEYTKYRGCRAYSIEFQSPAGQVHAYLEVCFGVPMLRIRCDAEKFDEVYHPDIEKLEGLGMLETE